VSKREKKDIKIEKTYEEREGSYWKRKRVKEREREEGRVRGGEREK
jgi:hypothetical protein